MISRLTQPTHQSALRDAVTQAKTALTEAIAAGEPARQALLKKHAKRCKQGYTLTAACVLELVRHHMVMLQTRASMHIPKTATKAAKAAKMATNLTKYGKETFTALCKHLEEHHGCEWWAGGPVGVLAAAAAAG